MKSLVAIVVIILILSACKKNRTPEDRLFDCNKALYSNYSVDFNNYLDTLEEFYIKLEVLDSKSPESKIKYFEYVLDSGLPKITTEFQISDKLKSIPQLPDDIRNCALDEFTSDELDTINYQKVINYIKEEYENTNFRNPKTSARAHLKYLTVEDFEHPYYRAMFLLELPSDYSFIAKL